MKLSKKILAAFSAATLLATAAVFTSCTEDDDEDAFSGDTVEFDNGRVLIKTDESGTDKTKTSQFVLSNVTDIKQAKTADETKTGYLNLINDSYFYRAFKKTVTKHYDSTCTITITPNDLNIHPNANGVAGFVFGLTSKDVTAEDTVTKGTAYTFGLAAVRWNATDNKAQYYVAWEDGAVVKSNNYQTSNEFVDINGDDLPTVNGEKYFSGWADLGITSLTDGNLVIKVKVTANEDGSYKVEFFDANDTLLKTNEGVTSAKSGFETRTQALLARYANIYAGENFKAEYKFSDTNGEAVILEDDIVEE